MLALMGGALVRFIPGIGSFLGQLIGGWSEDKREARRIELEIRLEEARSKSALETKKVDFEIYQAMAGVQQSMNELSMTVADRKSAREFGSTLHRVMTATLETGAKMELPRWLLGLGWWLALIVEVFTAAVQPMIAATVFAVWTALKASLFLKAYALSGSVADSVIASMWGVEDWMLMESVVGFFLAGRALVRDRGAKSAASLRP